MSRLFSYLTFAVMTAGILSTASLAHAKGSGHSASHNSSHNLSQSHSQNHPQHSGQNKSNSHKDSDCHSCGHHDGQCGDKTGSGESNPGQTFYPGGVPFGKGPAGTPSNPKQVTQVHGFGGAPITTVASSGVGVGKQGGIFGAITQPTSTGANTGSKHATHGHGPSPAGRQTSDWDAAGEAVQGLGDAVGDGLSAVGSIFTGSFSGPPVK